MLLLVVVLLLILVLLLVLLLVVVRVGMEGGRAGGRGGVHKIIPPVVMLRRAVPVEAIIKINRSACSACSRRRRSVTAKGKVSLW